MRGVTLDKIYTWLYNIKFQLTRLMRGVTSRSRKHKPCINISTHTPHARRDSSFYLIQDSRIEISTHTPHARRDGVITWLKILTAWFQLTRLMRGVTRISAQRIITHIFQLTRLMRGVTSLNVAHWHLVVYFNSHASCEAWHKRYRYFCPPI